MTRLTLPFADNRFIRLLAVVMLAWLAATGGAIATTPDAEAKPPIYQPKAVKAVAIRREPDR